MQKMPPAIVSSPVAGKLPGFGTNVPLCLGEISPGAATTLRDGGQSGLWGGVTGTGHTFGLPGRRGRW